MSVRKPIRLDFTILRDGHGIVSSITTYEKTLKWNDLVKMLSLMYTECKNKLPEEDFDHTPYSELEGL